ncbi:MAG TPA: cytochrome c oxidase subunit 3 family protein [Polyangiaceae bacterium]|nr:cytochrome c oxidase subunit 3 family protein [Polyangiaceae bacterium]
MATQTEPLEVAEPHADHFESFAKQEHAAHVGVWLFLTSEVLLFGALFGLYTAYRNGYGAEFVEASHHNNRAIGTINTFILITSSFFAAWAVHSVRRSQRRAAVLSLIATLALGLTFLALKGVEYSDHFSHGIFPGTAYRFAELPTRGANIFFTLYFFMTGLHALHVIGGLTALTIVLVLTLRERYTPTRHTSLELSVLYWHLVDVIWIFLWPLMYLVG